MTGTLADRAGGGGGGGGGDRLKRNSWKSKSFSSGSRSYLPQPLNSRDRGGSARGRGARDKDVMLPNHQDNRPRKTRFLDSLRKSKKGSVPEDEIPTKDGCDSVYEHLQRFPEKTPDSCRSSIRSRGEPSSITTSQLFETDDQASIDSGPFLPTRLSRSKSYVIEGAEDGSTPVIIDVGNMKVECIVEEKHGTFSQGSQTEQVPAGLSAETSLELIKKLSIPALRRELDRKKVRYSKNDGKDQLQAKLQAVLKMEACPPSCPGNKGAKIVIHSEPAELKKRAQQIAGLAHQTDTPQVLSEATHQLSQVTQEVRVIRQLLEAHVHHLKAVSDHNNAECGCNAMLENLCHSLSHYHVRKLESQLQETLSEVQMLQLEKHSLMRAVTSICSRRTTASRFYNQSATTAVATKHLGSGGSGTATANGPTSCSPCIHGDCRIDYLTSLMTTVLQQTSAGYKN